MEAKLHVNEWLVHNFDYFGLETSEESNVVF